MSQLLCTRFQSKPSVGYFRHAIHRPGLPLHHARRRILPIAFRAGEIVEHRKAAAVGIQFERCPAAVPAMKLGRPIERPIAPGHQARRPTPIAFIGKLCRPAILNSAHPPICIGPQAKRTTERVQNSVTAAVPVQIEYLPSIFASATLSRPIKRPIPPFQQA
jgi:hypothetical protein